MAVGKNRRIFKDFIPLNNSNQKKNKEIEKGVLLLLTS